MPQTASGYPYPDDNSPGDVPYWSQQLAEATETKALQHSKGGTRRVAWGRNLLTFNNGSCVFAHNLGWTPSVVLTQEELSTTLFAIGARNMTSTSVEFRLILGSGALYTGQENVQWVAFE